MSEFKQGTVVLISNDPTMRKLLSAIISGLGFPSCSLSSIEEGIIRAHASHTILMVIDTCQPVEDTLSTLAQFGEDKVLSTMPMIVLTSQQFERQPPQVKSLAPVDVLIKPFTASAMRDHLEKYLIAGGGRIDSITEKELKDGI